MHMQHKHGLPVEARTMCSQYLSMVCFAPLGTRMVHLPPCSHCGSSHFGSIPALNR